MTTQIMNIYRIITFQKAFRIARFKSEPTHLKRNSGVNNQRTKTDSFVTTISTIHMYHQHPYDAVKFQLFPIQKIPAEYWSNQMYLNKVINIHIPHPCVCEPPDILTKNQHQNKNETCFLNTMQNHETSIFRNLLSNGPVLESFHRQDLPMLIAVLRDSINHHVDGETRLSSSNDR